MKGLWGELECDVKLTGTQQDVKRQERTSITELSAGRMPVQFHAERLGSLHRAQHVKQ